MSTLYPTASDDNTTLPNPTGSSTQNNPDHAAQHANVNDAVKAVEAKVGTGASTPTNNTFLIGNGTGTSTWSSVTSAQLASRVSDETGSGPLVFATSPTLTTPAVNTVNESTPANGVTIDGLNIKDGALNTNNSVVTNNITDSAVTYAKVATGMPVQVVSTTSTAVATGTTTIPADNTIPQITEGNEYMTLAITPKSATNVLVIQVVVMLANTVSAQLSVALFQDATANALAANGTWQNTGGGINSVPVTHTMTAGTTSSTTFRVRCGGHTAGTTTFNGSAGMGVFGAITKSSIVITEYKA